VTSCPVCHSRGYTERPEAGHLNPRQLCPVCAGEGRLVTEAGRAVLELLAVALEPQQLSSPESIARYLADHARRYQQDLARPTDPPLPSTLPAPSLPTPTLDCEDGLWYISDLTIPDGTLVSPGDTIDKRWQVENSGSCNWNEGYRLRRISGEALGVPGELALYPARSGPRAVLQIRFPAPAEPGTYRSAWQAYNPQGEAFGDPVFVEIIVGSGTP